MQLEDQNFVHCSKVREFPGTKDFLRIFKKEKEKKNFPENESLLLNRQYEEGDYNSEMSSYLGVRRSLAWHRDLQRDLDRVQAELRVLPLLECLEGGRHGAEIPGLADSRWLIK